MKGTKFQLKVWNYLKTIPKGHVKTYKQVAIAIKSPKSARAVANACGKNPYAPRIPCPVKGKNTNRGAKVVIAPKIRPEKYDILIPTKIKLL